MPYHILPAFRVKVVKKPRLDHWQGGPAYHEGAICTVCDRPLLLLWDISCSDPRFRVRGRSVFGHLERLPLYYCWTCAADMQYRVIENDQLKVFAKAGHVQGNDFPYKRFPLSFERRPIELAPLDQISKSLKAILNTDYPNGKLHRSAKKPLEKWLGRPVANQYDIWRHQFGGKPWLAQGPERIICPNEECSWRRRGWAMKILASIINDPPGGLPMLEAMQEVNKKKGHFNSWVQVTFHICRRCLSIHAANRCT